MLRNKTKNAMSHYFCKQHQSGTLHCRVAGGITGEMY